MSDTDEPATMPTMSWVDFLTERPPSTEPVKVTRIEEVIAGAVGLYAARPPLSIHCDSTDCGRRQTFDGIGDRHRLDNISVDGVFLRYRCRNCLLGTKWYACILLRQPEGTVSSYVATKVGEAPPFGDPLPTRIYRLVGDHQDLLLKGYRCEKQGLGLAAFAYYRRIVEDSKNRIIDEIIAVARETAGAEHLLDELEAAKRERQFSTAMAKIREGMPPSLMMKGHNPLELLHAVTSIAVHGMTDGEILGHATHARIVLVELAERIQFARRDRRAFDEAVSKLLEVRKRGRDDGA